MKRKKHSFSAILVALLSAFFISTAQSYSQTIPWYEVPIFQYAIFYNLNLEIDPGATMPTITSPVFSNQGIWSGNANVSYSSTVWAVNQVNTSGTDPYCMDYTDAGMPLGNFLLAGQPISHVAPITIVDSPGNSTNSTNAEAIINLPPPGVRAPQQIAYAATNQVYDFNAASLIVSNWSNGTNILGGGYTPTNNNFTVWLQDCVPHPFALPSNWVQLTNDYYACSNYYNGAYTSFSTNYVPNFQFTNVMAIKWTNNPTGTNRVFYASFSFLTNVAFYDFRESKTVQAVQINVAALGAWITNSAANGGSNWTFALCKDLGQGINSIFVYNAVPLTSSQLPAVRIINGQRLPCSTNYNGSYVTIVTSGLTVVTPQPLYVLGNYNVQIDGGNPVLGSANTANTYPAAFLADAITVLSSNWNDSDSPSVNSSYSSRIPANTTVNTACFAGIVPSSGTNYSGGGENFLRLEENWSGFTLTYNGSIVAMFPSEYATNYWQPTGNYYNAATRDWSFDTNFLTLGNLPPLTPTVVNSNSAPVITAQPTNEIALLGQSTNFIVTAAGMPAVGYQWNFKGTNILGATNASLTLTNLQLSNAGNYAAQVTNIWGSVMSSNATLSIYTSAVPILNALSFSTSNGIQFTVSGVPGFNYAVQASTNLIDWTPLFTNTSPFIFTDMDAPDFPQQFYRIIYPP